MPDHEAECKWRLVLCSLCGDKIRAFEGEVLFDRVLHFQHLNLASDFQSGYGVDGC